MDDAGKISAWRTDMWIPKATASLPNMPLLALDAAGIEQTPGITTGLISQNGDPPYAVPHQEVVVHWLATSPLRPSNFRAPGKVANCFAVESFTDMLAAAAKRDAVEFRLQALSDPRGVEVIRRAAALIGWQPRPSPSPPATASGRGFAYMHYKHNESYVAMAMEVDVDRASGAIKVRRVACAHDCGLVINPDALKAQIEGNILQTLSRTLLRGGRVRPRARDERRLGKLSDPAFPGCAGDRDRHREPAQRSAARCRRGVGHARAGGARQRGVRRRRRPPDNRAVHAGKGAHGIEVTGLPAAAKRPLCCERCPARGM